MMPLLQMDEHTDWVNQLIYLRECNAVLSCSNDTSIKLWKIPDETNWLNKTQANQPQQ